jgi:Xaa-Pro aminopeptidase
MSLPPLPIDPPSVKQRQARLVGELQRRRCGLVVLTRPESIQWLTGARVAPLFTSAAAIDDTGKVVLVLPECSAETPAVADRVATYAEKRLSTMRDASEQRISSIEALLDAVGAAPRRAGCEFTAVPRQLTAALDGDWIDFDATMFRLRRRKDPDELALLARANLANRAMYERAREVVAPGLNELDLYAELHAVAVRTLGEPLTYFGQDFRCNARGGAPRDRPAEAGELWVLDLGVGYRGYFSDNARTLAVAEPTPDQQVAWERLAEALALVERTARPGGSCKELFEAVSRLLASASPWVFNHHLGHGVGLAPHEAPRLNPNWDDRFEVGDYFTAEPGLYHESLKHGVRLEQNYVVTETGVELLTDWPLGLR